jgi:hypothetical protein
MSTPRLRTHDRLTNWSHTAVAALLTATVLLGSLSMTATALGDPELVAVLAALGCGLALLGLALTAVQRRRLAATPAAPA